MTTSGLHPDAGPGPAVAWIGLGAMGLPMAARLVQAGYELHAVGHRNPAPIERLRAAGASIASSPRTAAEQAAVLFTMVRDEDDTDGVLHGPDGALAGLTEGDTLVVCSTLSARFCRDLAAACERRGVDVVDAPVSGGAPRAEAGTLTMMVGGRDAAVRRCMPLLEQLSSNVIHLGGTGSGQQAKIINNAIKIGILALTTEGLELGFTVGLDGDALLRVLGSSSAASQVVENWPYYLRFKTEHRPGGPLEMLHKDMGFALELAGDLGVDVPLFQAASKVDVGRVPQRGPRR